MRSIQDEQGQTWDVAVGKESYGTLVLLFSQRQGPGIRKGDVMAAANHLQAARELESLSEGELQRMLAAAKTWSA